MGHRKGVKRWPYDIRILCHNYNLFNMEREPWGTDIILLLKLYKYDGSSQLERNLGTAPNPPHWYVWCISLDTYSAKLWGSSGVGENFVLLSLIAKNYDNSLFYSTKSISKKVTPMILIQICTLYRPRQALMSPYNLFGKSLFSHFHTEPLFPRGIISKIFRVYTWFYLKRRQIH